jgi:hypothetical protein
LEAILQELCDRRPEIARRRRAHGIPPNWPRSGNASVVPLRRFGGRPFWVAVVSLTLLLVTGALSAARIAASALAERRLDREGVHVDAVILEIETVRPIRVGPAQATYLVRYRFDLPNRVVTARATLHGERWSALRRGATLSVRYVRSRPEQNAPEGAELGRGTGIWFTFGLAMSVFCGVLLGALLTARWREGTNRD